MRFFFAALLLVVGLSNLGAQQAPRVDFAKVVVERRQGVEWCVLDAQISGSVAVSLDRVRAVIEDYESYPVLFPRIKEVAVTRSTEAVLLSELVVISAMGIVNTNRFTLRLVASEPRPRVVHLTWTQAKTDGTIDSLEGGWVLEDVGAVPKPLVKVTYRTMSAVPVRLPGQDLVIGMFLGDETKGVVESVFKKALSR